VNLNLFGSKEGSRWFADYEARNIGYHDQQYAASINGMGKIFANVSFFQLPLNYAFKDDGYVRTPYSVDGLQLDDATQAAVQAGTVVAWPANPTLTSAWVNKAQAIDLGSRRSQFDASVVYSATSAIDLNAGVRTYSRTGTQPWGASWGFSAATELPLTLDNRTTDFTVGAAWTNDRAGVQVSFDNSSFNNNNESITFDNPGTLTDSLTKGAARGLMAVMPSNSMWTVRGSGVAHLAAHSTITGAFATSRSEQNEPLQPITSNSLLGVTTPGRATADAKADISMFQVGFNSRPMPKTWFTARYRYRNFDNKTPAYVSAVTLFDTSITAEDSVEPSEYLDFKTQNVQLAASYSLIRYATVRFDYFFNKLDQTFREWPTVKENVERVSFDSVGLQFATLRASYEHSTRRGSGTYEVPDGQQPGARMYDDADRTRNSGLVMLTLTPMPVVGVTFSANLGKDTYDDPLQEFGLLNNKNQVYTVGLDATPNDMVSAGVSYGYEKYTAVSASRNANPAPDPSFFDPNRNWFDNHDERVHTVTANLTVAKVVPNAEVQFGYDYSHSNQGYKYSGPNITRLMGLPPAPYAVGFTGTFGQLPNVIDTINRASVNLRYFFTQRLAANITYWFDKYSVEDFATPFRLDTPGALLLGYGWRPYTAHSVFLNALYRF
jgi:MtrB/PioB family decaheme-associated outer membrane protein